MGPAESRRRRHRISGKPSGEKWNAGWVWELGVLELSRLAALKETHNETNRRVWQSSNSTALQWAMSLVCVITPPQRHSKTAYDSAVRLRQPPSLPRPGCQAIPSCRFPTFCTLAVPFLLNVAVLELQLLVRDRPSRGHGKQLLDPRVAVAQLTSSHGAVVEVEASELATLATAPRPPLPSRGRAKLQSMSHLPYCSSLWHSGV